jgi:hypothetical protein
MSSIHAVWKNGHIVPMQPVDWPEGTTLAVEPIEEALVTHPESDVLGDDPASIARWLTWFDSLEPLQFTPQEEAEWQAAGEIGGIGESHNSIEGASGSWAFLNEALPLRHMCRGRLD